MQVQAAVKKETGRIAGGTIAGGCIMLLVFFVLHQVKPDVVPFDYRVILGAVLGCEISFLWELQYRRLLPQPMRRRHTDI